MNGDIRELGAKHDLHIVLLINQALQESEQSRLITQLYAIKKRFGYTVSAVASGIWTVDMAGIKGIVESGIFDAIYFSGDSVYVIRDGITSARRAGRQKNLFICVDHLLRKPVQSLRALVELQGVRHDAVWLPAVAALYCHGKLLDSLPRCIPGDGWATWLDRAWSLLLGTALLPMVLGAKWVGETLRQKAGAQSNPVTVPTELYVSTTGLARFGGEARLRGLPLRFGEQLVANYRRVLALDNNLDVRSTLPAAAPDDALLALPGWIATPEGCYLLDIVPADSDPSDEPRLSACEDGRRVFNLPRQILQIRRVGLLPKRDVKTRLVFISSNFEKETFIAAGLYAIAMQSHPEVEVSFTDDASTDDSVTIAKQFVELLVNGSDHFKISVNDINRGTYWIRNECIYSTADSDAVFLVNDSDDVSSLQRGWLQAHWLVAEPQASGCFMDIVRVDENYTPLRLDTEIERYGTASLSFRGSLVGEVGYFENIKRNADTEYIERVKLLKGKGAFPWHRYPCLFQVFDGSNITSDIYQREVGSNSLVVNNASRMQHMLLFRRQHQSMNTKKALTTYTFPQSGISADHLPLGEQFLIDGYRSTDAIAILTTTVNEATCRMLAAGSVPVLKVRAINEAWERGEVHIYGDKGVLFKSDLGTACALSHLMGPMGFRGFLLICGELPRMLLATEPGPVIQALFPAILLSKRRADMNPILIQEDDHDEMKVLPIPVEGLSRKTVAQHIRHNSVLLHTDRLGSLVPSLL